ncbi:hypothetical protein HGRIS_006128 [Hohenbuehelia grisea]|uniref:F-box domain-containing protein n=1 Tax=Hohenbuehelia grisea TaxID=104357 RepID=A0ABR3JZE9_9AGAR
MDRLCGQSPLHTPTLGSSLIDNIPDEILQLVFYELNDPGPLTLASKRFYHFSQDSFVRAHYFLARYGATQAMYYALGRGRVLNERVLDILLTSGAHLSRYLIQLAIHHYFRTQSHFIKTAWVRNVPFNVFTYFLQLSAAKYGDIPTGKNEDDGSVFAAFLKESRYPLGMRSIGWESIRDILDKYKFIPFCNKDPIMAQFPLVLAIEPRLLPLAVANGFHMDSKYRDFVFRKMFERQATITETRADEIAQNVRELCRLDPSMFLSRTVAAEICMESTTNESAYAALKNLDRTGALLFSLSSLVEELIKLFISTRSLSLATTGQTIRQLYKDFPSQDPIARLVLLCTIFIQETSWPHQLSIQAVPPQTVTESLKARFDELGFGTGPTRTELIAVLLNPFVEKHWPVTEWAKWNGEPETLFVEVNDVGAGSSGSSRSNRSNGRSRAGRRSTESKPATERAGAVGLGLDQDGIREFIEEVAEKLLEVGCKAKMLKKMYDRYDYLRETIERVVVEKHQIHVDDLPSWEDDDICRRYQAKLSRDFSLLRSGTGLEGVDLVHRGQEEGEEVDSSEEVVVLEEDGAAHPVEAEAGGSAVEEPVLGAIGQDTLSTMIKQDELAPSRPRRRSFYMYSLYTESMNRLPYPNDATHVARWVKSQFGVRNRVTAIFLTHAVINENATLLNNFFGYTDSHVPRAAANAVPVTFKHFQLLARLGRAPNWTMYNEIETGAEFYYTEDDYLSDAEKVAPKPRAVPKVKSEGSQARTIGHYATSRSRTPAHHLHDRGRKRPRREAAAAVRSYVVPDSDDEAIIADSDEEMDEAYVNAVHVRQKKAETNLQKWITHLSALCKEEQRKYKEKKKVHDKGPQSGYRVRHQKNDFFRSLSAQLRHLRKLDYDQRLKIYGPELADASYSDDDDDEYVNKAHRSQRRKTARPT